MKILTLEEAYAKAPPKAVPDEFGLIEDGKGIEWAECLSEHDDQDAHRAALLAHAFNVLPEVVELLELAANQASILAAHIPSEAHLYHADEAKMRAALAKANRVQIPELS